MRILRDPAPETSGGGIPATPEPAKAAAATPTPTPAATPVVPPPPATISLTPEEYKRALDAQTRLAEIEAESKRREDEKEAARLKALAEKGQAEEALAQLRTNKDQEIARERERASALEREILGDRKTSVISKALDGVAWVSAEAAADAREILEARFEAVRDAATGVVSVREKGTGRPADDVIKEWQASPKAAHYLKPTTTGGAGASGTHQTGTPPPPEDPMVAQLKKIVADRKTGAPGLAGTYGNN